MSRHRATTADRAPRRQRSAAPPATTPAGPTTGRRAARARGTLAALAALTLLAACGSEDAGGTEDPDGDAAAAARPAPVERASADPGPAPLPLPPPAVDTPVTWETDLRDLEVGSRYVFDGPAVVAADGSDEIVLCFSVDEVGHDGVAWCSGTDMILQLPDGLDPADVGMERRVDGWEGTGWATIEITDTTSAPPRGIVHGFEEPDRSHEDPGAPIAEGCPPRAEDMGALVSVPDADPMFAEQVNVAMHSLCLTEEEAVAHVEGQMDRMFFRDGLYETHHDCVGGFTYDVHAVTMTVYSADAACDAAVSQAAAGMPFDVVTERRAHSLADLERLADALNAAPPSTPEHFLSAGVLLETGAVLLHVSAGADARHWSDPPATLADTRPAHELLDDASACPDCPVLLGISAAPAPER